MMASANVAKWNGDDYQARFFWYCACELLEPETKVEKVGFEDPMHKSFDDVSVYYRSGFRRVADFYQVKFHVNQSGSLTAAALIDPKFIHADSVSLLKRAHNSFKRLEKPEGIRFNLYTPWDFHPDDVLARIINNQDRQINWNKLAKNGAKSKTGKVRTMWMTHLSIENEEELQVFLETLRFKIGPSLHDLGKHLNTRLISVGLKSVDPEITNEYDSLARDLVSQNRNALTRSDLEDILKERNLWNGGPKIKDARVSLGMRSRMPFAEDMENKVEHICCVCDFFPSRFIQKQKLWNSTVYPAVTKFVAEHLTSGRDYLLRLDTHTSIAFAAGHHLPTKAGVKVYLIQKTISGETEWTIPDQITPADDVKFDMVPLGNDGHEVAVAVSIAQDLREEVLAYVPSALLKVGQILFVTPQSGPGLMAITSAGHAAAMAQTLAQKLRAMRLGFSAETRIHLFASAPNGFTFSLGRFTSSHHYWTLYEYDFEGVTGYTPSISLPPLNNIDVTRLATDIALERG